MFNLMFSQMYPGEEKIVSTAFNQALPKLYAMSMMWTLNARGGMRAIHRDRGYSSSGADDRARTTRNVSIMICQLNLLFGDDIWHGRGITWNWQPTTAFKYIPTQKQRTISTYVPVCLESSIMMFTYASA